MRIGTVDRPFRPYAVGTSRIAADLPLQPAHPSAGGHAPAPMRARSPRRTPPAWNGPTAAGSASARPSGEASCSNVGIACVPKAEECTRR